jgi:hypothetical protein
MKMNELLARENWTNVYQYLAAYLRYLPHIYPKQQQRHATWNLQGYAEVHQDIVKRRASGRRLASLRATVRPLSLLVSATA